MTLRFLNLERIEINTMSRYLDECSGKLSFYEASLNQNLLNRFVYPMSGSYFSTVSSTENLTETDLSAIAKMVKQNYHISNGVYGIRVYGVEKDESAPENQYKMYFIVSHFGLPERKRSVATT